MSETPWMTQRSPKKKTAEDALGTTIVTSVNLQVHLISSGLMRRRVCNVVSIIDNAPTIEEGMDAAVPVDAQNAPTRDLENCRQFSTAPTPIICFLERRKKNRTDDQTA